MVENALLHGTRDPPARAEILVRARRTPNGLRLTVRDNGPGFTDPGAAAEGVGLGNTRERLLEMYGGAAALRIDSPYYRRRPHGPQAPAWRRDAAIRERLMIRDLIADDEAPARKTIRRFLVGEDDVAVVAEAAEGAAAVEEVLRH